MSHNQVKQQSIIQYDRYLTHFLGPKSQTYLHRFSRFFHSSRQRVPILYIRPPLSASKLPIRMRHLEDSHLVRGSLGPPESKTQTASRSVQPFLQFSRSWMTDRSTDRLFYYSVCSNRPHLILRSTAMRPNSGSMSKRYNSGKTVPHH